MTRIADSLANTIANTRVIEGKSSSKICSQILNTPDVSVGIHIQEDRGETAFRAYIHGSNNQQEAWVLKAVRETVFISQLGGVCSWKGSPSGSCL